MFGRGTSLSLSLSLACLSVSPAWGSKIQHQDMFKHTGAFTNATNNTHEFKDVAYFLDINEANFHNYGTMIFNNYAYFYATTNTFGDYATFTNEGIMSFDGSVQNAILNIKFKSLTNNGTLSADGGLFYGAIATTSGSTINVTGTNLTTFKQGRLGDTFTNVAGANFTNEGNVKFESGFTNYGTFINNKGKVEFQQDVINEGGTFVNMGDAEFKQDFTSKGGTFTSDGTYVSNGITVTGLFVSLTFWGKANFFADEKGTKLLDLTNGNNGTMTFKNETNFKTLKNYGTLNADGATFDGQITTNSGSTINVTGTNLTTFKQALTNVKGAIFTNKGNVKFGSGFTNYGTLNADGATFDGQITTNSGSTINVTGTNLTTFKQGLGDTFTNVDGANFTNRGNAKFESGFTNYGTFESNGKVEFGDHIYNSNLFHISGGSASFGSNFNNKNNGILRITQGKFTSYGVINEADARIELKGGQLQVIGGGHLFNYGTLIFSATTLPSGQLQMGQFQGSLSFQKGGKIQVDVTGLSFGEKYHIIVVTTGLIGDILYKVEFVNKAGTSVSGWSYNSCGWIFGSTNPDDSLCNIVPQPPQPEPEPKPEQPNPEKPNQSNSVKNYETLQKTLESKLFGMSASIIHQSAADTDETIKTSLITQPKNMMEVFKSDTLTSPLNSAYVSRLTASSKAIMNDSSNFINPLERASQTQFFATPFGGVLAGENLSGTLFGMSIGLTHIDDEYIAQGYFSYAKGKSTQDLTTQSTELNANLFQVGAFIRLFFYEKLETDINANFIFGKFELNNAWLDNALLNSNSKFNNYQANLGATLGYRFGESFSLKPFVGVQGYYEKQGEFNQESGLELTSETYSSLVFDALAGLETRYIFDNGSFIFAKASYENQLYNSHKEIFMRVAHNDTLTYENESYDNVINANIGARLLSTKNFKLDIEALFKHYGNGIYFGGNLSAKISF